MDLKEGLVGKQSSYSYMFDQAFKDARQSKGKKYDGRIDWTRINGLEARDKNDYSTARTNTFKKLEEAYNSDGDTRSKAHLAMTQIKLVTNYRLGKLVVGSPSYERHVKVYNAWRKQWNDWHLKYNILPAPPAPAV